MDVLILCVYDLRQPTGIRFCRQNTTGGKIRHSLTKGRASMGREEGDWVSGFVRGPEMGNRVLWVKLNLSYTARGIANVWALAIRRRQNPLPSSFGIGSQGLRGERNKASCHSWNPATFALETRRFRKQCNFQAVGN
jgi:hypothetical protein